MHTCGESMYSCDACTESQDAARTRAALDHAREAMLAKIRALVPTSEEAEVRRSVASAMAGGTADGPTQRGWDPTEFEG